MENIQSILSCPTLKNVNMLRGFVGLCTYYRKFVKGFSQLTTPFTNITNKGAFCWTKNAEKSFHNMKQEMSSFLLLSLPYFTQHFVLESDASNEDIGHALMKNQHPFCYKSINLQPHECNYSIYDMKILSIMHPLEKFQQYLVGNKFVVKTNHNGLKHFLSQKELSCTKISGSTK